MTRDGALKPSKPSDLPQPTVPPYPDTQNETARQLTRENRLQVLERVQSLARLIRSQRFDPAEVANVGNLQALSKFLPACMAHEDERGKAFAVLKDLYLHSLSLLKHCLTSPEAIASRTSSKPWAWVPPEKYREEVQACEILVRHIIDGLAVYLEAHEHSHEDENVTATPSTLVIGAFIGAFEAFLTEEAYDYLPIKIRREMIDLVGLCASDKRVRRFLIKRKKPLLARSLGRSKDAATLEFGIAAAFRINMEKGGKRQDAHTDLLFPSSLYSPQCGSELRNRWKNLPYEATDQRKFKREFLEKFQALDKSQPDTFMILDETILIDSVKQKLGRGHCEDASQSHWLAVNERSMTCWILNQSDVEGRTLLDLPFQDIHYLVLELRTTSVQVRVDVSLEQCQPGGRISDNTMKRSVHIVIELSRADLPRLKTALRLRDMDWTESSNEEGYGSQAVARNRQKASQSQDVHVVNEDPENQQAHDMEDRAKEVLHSVRSSPTDPSDDERRHLPTKQLAGTSKHSSKFRLEQGDVQAQPESMGNMSLDNSFDSDLPELPSKLQVKTDTDRQQRGAALPLRLPPNLTPVDHRSVMNNPQTEPNAIKAGGTNGKTRSSKSQNEATSVSGPLVGVTCLDATGTEPTVTHEGKGIPPNVPAQSEIRNIKARATRKARDSGFSEKLSTVPEQESRDEQAEDTDYDDVQEPHDPPKNKVRGGRTYTRNSDKPKTSPRPKKPVAAKKAKKSDLTKRRDGSEEYVVVDPKKSKTDKAVQPEQRVTRSSRRARPAADGEARDQAEQDKESRKPSIGNLQHATQSAHERDQPSPQLQNIGRKASSRGATKADTEIDNFFNRGTETKRTGTSKANCNFQAMIQVQAKKGASQIVRASEDATRGDNTEVNGFTAKLSTLHRHKQAPDSVQQPQAEHDIVDAFDNLLKGAMPDTSFHLGQGGQHLDGIAHEDEVNQGFATTEDAYMETSFSDHVYDENARTQAASPGKIQQDNHHETAILPQTTANVEEHVDRISAIEQSSTCVADDAERPDEAVTRDPLPTTTSDVRRTKKAEKPMGKIKALENADPPTQHVNELAKSPNSAPLPSGVSLQRGSSTQEDRDRSTHISAPKIQNKFSPNVGERRSSAYQSGSQSAHTVTEGTHLPRGGTLQHLQTFQTVPERGDATFSVLDKLQPSVLAQSRTMQDDRPQGQIAREHDAGTDTFAELSNRLAQILVQNHRNGLAVYKAAKSEGIGQIIDVVEVGCMEAEEMDTNYLDILRGENEDVRKHARSGLAPFQGLLAEIQEQKNTIGDRIAKIKQQGRSAGRDKEELSPFSSIKGIRNAG